MCFQVYRPSDFSYLLPDEGDIGNQQPDPERALMINRILKEHLIKFRAHIYELLQRIDTQYKSNNAFLEWANSQNSRDINAFKSSYIKCGIPFFKDALGNAAPINDDYKFRKHVLREYFPFDHTQSGFCWKTKEKVALITGIKNQMIEYIKSQQSRKVCQETRTRGKFQKLKFISGSQDLQQSSVRELYDTIEKDYQDFTINWNILSFGDLNGTHSVSECMGMWNSYLRPDLNREPFTEEENAVLMNAMTENKYTNWDVIASKLDRRSALQTFIHFHSTFSRICPANVRWTPEEDEKLLKAIDTFSPNGYMNWNKIGQALPARNRIQCYNRYLIISKYQSQRKGVFSPEEDRIVLSYVDKYGENFSKMPKDLLPSRTVIQIRNHYNVALRHKGTIAPWTFEEDKKLMEYVEREGTNKWRGISDILKTHNRIACRTRYLTISKFLSKNPKSKLEDVPIRLKTITAVQKAKMASTSSLGSDDESKNLSSSSKKAPTQTYHKLKSENPALFQLLKTTFGYDLGARELHGDSQKIQMLRWLLGIDGTAIIGRRTYIFTKNQILKLRDALTYRLESTLVNEMKFATKHAQFLMPPNWNTTVGLRALVIKMHEDPVNNVVHIPVAKKTVDYCRALEDFQKLFFSLFYWSAILSKLDRDEVNQIHYQKNITRNLTTEELFKQFNRRLPFTSGFSLKRSHATPKTYASKHHKPSS